MAFIPVSLTLSVRVNLNNNKVVFPDKLETLALYVSCEDLLTPPDKRGKTAPPQASGQARPAKRAHQLSIKETVCSDRSPLKGWTIEDVGILRNGGTNRPDVRIAKITLDGAALRKLDNDAERSLYAAFLSQQTIRLNVLIDDLIEAPLLLKLQLVYGT